MKTIHLFTALTLVAFAAFIHAGNAAPGDLDLTFGSGGKITTPIGFGSSVAIQSDGKIVVAGGRAIARFMTSGALDTSFGTGGKVTTPIGNGMSMAIQSDGKMVVAGSSSNGSDDDFAVVRYTVNGELDASFGTGGLVTTPIGSANDFGRGVALQGDGKILVAGSSNIGSGNRIVLVRYTPSGMPDASFGLAGTVITPPISTNDGAYGIAVQSDGKIVVSGTSGGDFVTIRYTGSGELDTTFGTGGAAITTFGNFRDVGYKVTIQGDGKILVIGAYNVTGSSDNGFAVARYTTSGFLDTSFGSGGKVSTPKETPGLGGFGVVGGAIQSDGKIVVVAYSNNGSDNDFAVIRYTANGVLDPIFGIGGKVTTQIEGNDSGRSVVIQSDGKIVVVGSSSNGSNTAVVRYEGDNDLETFPPTLTTPNSGSAATNTMNVAFFLPEAALPGSVKLTFTGAVTRVLTLATVNESAGAHAFTLDALSPLPSTDIASGSPIPDGAYTVVLSYQDALGNPPASSAPALNVTVNIDTDGDAVLDKYETGTGIYVSPTDTGTSPTNPDTDGDGLTDGQEVNTYQSNPNLRDTDEDGFDDGFEVATGFSPTSTASTPDALSSIRTAAEYRFNAANGISYRIEASTDFTNWSTIETNILGTGGVITRFYSIEGQPRRFFRSRRN